MGEMSDLRTRALKVLPGGVSSNVRMPNRGTFIDHGRGSRLWDDQGREYIDYLLGQGPAFLGHADPVVNEAVAGSVQRGMVFGAQHDLEVEAVESLLAAIGWADQARLGVSGTEAVQGALRLARSATGRRKVVRFAGQYHGWIDNVLMSFDLDGGHVASAGQVPDALEDWFVVEFNDTVALEALFTSHGDEIAAVILEPMMCNSGAIPPREGFLQFVRALTRRYRAALIFDEVITGFRLALGGAAEFFGVAPDIAVFGKAIAGGWPVSAIAATNEMWESVSSGATNHSGTFNASVMAAAAVRATIAQLTAHPPYSEIERLGSRLMTGIAAQSDSIHVQGLPVAFHVSFGDSAPVQTYSALGTLDLPRYARFSRTLAAHGLWVAERGIWYLSAAHTPEDIDESLERFAAAFDEFDPAVSAR